MKHYESRGLSVAAYAWGAVALAVTLFGTWRYNSRMAVEEVDGYAQGAMALINDVGPALLVVAFAVLLKNRQWIGSAVTGFALVGYLGLSFVNVIGYSATGAFSAVEHAKVSHAATVKLTEAQNELLLKERAEERAAIRKQIDTAIRKKDRATAEMLYAQLGLQAAVPVRLAQAEEARMVDPQAAMIAKKTGVSEETARENRAIMASGFLILSKLFGFGLGAHFWPRRKQEIAAAAVPAPAPVVAEGSIIAPVVDAPALQVVNDNTAEEPQFTLALDASEIDDIAAGRATRAAQVKRFIEENIVAERRGAIHASSMYRAYENWCDDNGEEPLTKTMFGRLMTSEGEPLGFGKGRDVGNNITYTGVALLVNGQRIATAA